MKLAIEVVLQTCLAFFATLFFARIIGKKQIGELTFYDYINGITFGSIAANMATDINQRTSQHLMGLFLFALLTFLMQYIALKSRPARKVIEGEPTILIHNGKILEDNMSKTRFNTEDLISELRQNNIFDIKNVHFAILETNGRLSTLPISDEKIVTLKDLDIKGEEQAVNTELILDGEIIKPNLDQHQLTEEWLKEKIREQNVSLEDIMLVEFNPIDQTLYFDFKDDNLGEDEVDISDNS